jgi:hypothetical protein
MSPQDGAGEASEELSSLDITTLRKLAVRVLHFPFEHKRFVSILGGWVFGSSC